MKTVGDILKEARNRKKYSLRNVELKTKIKSEFLEAIENSNWDTLPEFPVVSGFVKSISSYLDVDQNLSMALLKRDYPPKKLHINPKPDVGGKFSWTPKYTFLVGIFVVIAVVLGYLGLQFCKFNSPPTLIVNNPKDGITLKTRNIDVDGKTDPDVTVKVNNQSTLVDEQGIFIAKIEIFEGTKEIVVEAISRSGKKTTIKRNIKVE